MNSTRRQFLGLTSLLLLGGLLPASSLAEPQKKTQKPKAKKAKAKGASNLSQQVNQYIAQQRQKGRVAKNERTAWVVADLNHGRDVVALNGSTPLQCASMVKPLVALAYLHAHYRVNARKYPLGAREERLMRDMLVRSSNQATNAFMWALGGPSAVQTLLKRHYGALLQQTQIVEMIPLGGRTYRNRASAQDYSRFLKALWRNQLPASVYLKSLMALPNRDRIRDGTRHVPRSARIYDKTGTTATLCGNMGIVACRGRNGRIYPYTFVGIIERRSRVGNLVRWSRARGNVIREVSDMVYLDFAKRYPLS